MKRCCCERVPEPPKHPDWESVTVRCICGGLIIRYNVIRPDDIALRFIAKP